MASSQRALATPRRAAVRRDELPETGSDSGTLAMIAGGAVVAGAGLLVVDPPPAQPGPHELTGMPGRTGGPRSCARQRPAGRRSPRSSPASSRSPVRRRRPATRSTDALLVGVGVACIVVIGSRAPWWVASGRRRRRPGHRPRPAPDGRRRRRPRGRRCGPGTSRRPAPWILAGSLGVTFNVLVRSELGGPIRHVGGDRHGRRRRSCSCSAPGTCPTRVALAVVGRRSCCSSCSPAPPSPASATPRRSPATTSRPG